MPGSYDDVIDTKVGLDLVCFRIKPSFLQIRPYKAIIPTESLHRRRLAPGVSWSRGNDRGVSEGQSRRSQNEPLGNQLSRPKHSSHTEFIPRVLHLVDEKIFSTVVDWRTSAPKDGMQAANLYSAADMTSLDTHRTSIQKQPEVLLCLVGLSRRYFLGDDMYPIFLDDDDRDMDLFNLISASNPTKSCDRYGGCGSGIRIPRDTVHHREVAARLCQRRPAPDNYRGGEAEDQFQDEVAYEIPPIGNASAMGVSLETGLENKVAALGPPVNKRRRKRGNNEAEANAPPKLLRRDYDAFRPAQSTHEGKSLASMGLDVGSLLSTPAAQDPSTATKSVSDPEPLSYANPLPHLEKDIAQSSKGTATEILTEDAVTADVNIQFSVGSPESGRSSSVPSMVGSSGDYNITLARKVAMGSQLRLRFEQEVRLLKKARSKIARRDHRIQVMGKENIKAAFEEFKKYEDDKVKQRCSEMDARLDKLSVDFDEELYPHMLTTIAEIRQAFADVVSAGLAKGMSEGLKYGIKHGKAGRDLADVEAYELESNNKLVKSLQDLKDLKYLMIDQLEKLKDASVDLIMASLYLESDTEEDTPQWIYDLRPSSSQLKIPVYPEVRDHEDLWAVKEEMLLEDAIAANISRAKKKKKCRVVCRTHGIGFAHHARSDGIPFSAPIVPQGLAILLADAATQTEA
nr:hypothetical protein [Tanacetum cinerariifolium]